MSRVLFAKAPEERLSGRCKYAEDRSDTDTWGALMQAPILSIRDRDLQLIAQVHVR
jgi:hypothetical protein